MNLQKSHSHNFVPPKIKPAFNPIHERINIRPHKVPVNIPVGTIVPHGHSKPMSTGVNGK
jgi:hypothetical protein